jgi:hypothetical protein
MSKTWTIKLHEIDLLLQRAFWRPLFHITFGVHVLPLIAAVLVFVVFAVDTQLYEVYTGYLEVSSVSASAARATGVLAALVILSLISASICEAHYSLKPTQISAAVHDGPNRHTSSGLGRLEPRVTSVLALSPWLGLAVGVFGARNIVANRYCHLLLVADVPAEKLATMHPFLKPNDWLIALAVMFLGVAVTRFCGLDRHNRNAQRVQALIAPALCAFLFLLFTNSPSIESWSAWTVSFVVLTTICYFLIHHWLCLRRTGAVYNRPSNELGYFAARSENEANHNTDRQNRSATRRHLSRWLPLSAIRSWVRTNPERSWRGVFLVWALLPWLALASYFPIVMLLGPSASPPACGADTAMTSATAWSVPRSGNWAIFPLAMCFVLGAGLLICSAIHRFSSAPQRQLAIVSLVLALIVIGGSVSGLNYFGVLDAHTLVAFSRLVGPVGMTGLIALFLIAVFAVLAGLSQHSGFPALTIVVLAIVTSTIISSYSAWIVLALGVAWLAMVVMAFLSGRYAVGVITAVLMGLAFLSWHDSRPPPIDRFSSSGDPETTSLEQAFACWLNHRGIATGSQQNECQHQSGEFVSSVPRPTAVKYPVFIIAAEGGGIYAAGAVALFLAKAQECAPHFFEHIFAISAVSGGAIGATIFQVLAHEAVAAPPAGAYMEADGSAKAACAQHSGTNQRSRGQTLEQNVEAIFEDDHLSPLIGAIYPEVLGIGAGRSYAFEASFQDSVATRDQRAGRSLSAPFTQHWADRGAPALVLNSTWVETGFRTAFAPFRLNDINESLYSFADPQMPDDRCPSLRDKRFCVTLMAATGVSARFPFILPPFSVGLREGRRVKRWNFVDGGYADKSGALTALDIWRALKKKAPANVDLRLILITSAQPSPNLARINGTAFRDTMTPVDTLLEVRGNLGNEAIAQACREIYPEDANRTSEMRSASNAFGREMNSSCIRRSMDNEPTLQLVEIQNLTLGLTLGWKISRTGMAVISWMLGEAEDCTDMVRRSLSNAVQSDEDSALSVQDSNDQLTTEIVHRNSCVLRSIVESSGSYEAETKVQ